MYILSAEQVRDWDSFTIQHEPIASIDLMERAARKSVEWISTKKFQHKKFYIICGKGNNGGDGLAIGRLLMNGGYSVSIYILESGKNGNEDFEMNMQRLHDMNFPEIYFIKSREHFPSIHSDDIIVDALFGSGLNKPLQGLPVQLIEHINLPGALIISIDLPSGLFMDQSSKNLAIIKANYSLTFQCMKMGFLMQENADVIGEVHVLDIGLHPGFVNVLRWSHYEMMDSPLIRVIYKTRNRFAHKGSFGHALMIGGSYGKMGAVVLATKACLRSGAGLTTAFIPRCGYVIMQTALPEAMVITDADEELLSSLPEDIEKYTAIGIGPGMATAETTKNMLSFIIKRFSKPIVIDADGLNCLAMQTDMLKQLPAFSILTPHPKEFERLFGKTENDFARMELAQQKAKELNCIIVLKSHHTLIALPGGMCYFNSTGNAGMAKGGSGDVLTGIITSLLAAGYQPEQAAILGVYLHGVAGDIAAETTGQESMMARDLIHFIPKAFKKISFKKG